jgi:hypothetical protein
METQPEFGFKELFTHLIGDMAKAVAERPGESQQQQGTRIQAATYMVVGLQPRDVIEAMLAGHCMMFHELLVDSMRNTMRGEADQVRRATRANIVTMNQAFDNCLSRLEYFQTRPSEGRRDAAENAQSETGEPAARAQREVFGPGTGTKPGARKAEATAVFTPSQEAIDACVVSPEAMAALDAGDPVRFARAMGIKEPGTADVAAAPVQMPARNGRVSGNGRADDAGGNGASNPRPG